MVPNPDPSVICLSTSSIAPIDAQPVVGIIDIEIDGQAATIDTIAVLPGTSRRGVGSALLNHAMQLLPSTVTSLDAWTRGDAGAKAWYQKFGFRENFRYLHVYLASGDSLDGFAVPQPLSKPVTAFMHAGSDHEEHMRAAYQRVHVCRQYLLPVAGGA